MTALVFVIPDGNFVAASLLIIPAANSRNLSEIPRSSKPLSPPPRVTTAIA